MPAHRCSKKADAENRIITCDELLKVFREYADEVNPPEEPLRFEFNKRYYVEIAHARSEGFFLNCVHEQHSFETLVPYDGAKTGFTIEEFLEDFWNHHVRQKYNFDENREIQNASFSVTPSVPLKVFFPLLFFALPFLFLLMKEEVPKDTTDVILKAELFVLIATLPYWLLLIQHYAYTRGALFRISRKEKLVVMERNGKETAMRFSEITKARIIRSGEKPLYGHWAYLRIEAGPQKRIIVTDLLYENLEHIGEMLDCNVVQEPSLYPIILLKKKSAEDVAEEKEEHMERSAELEVRWSDKSRQELEEIVKNAEQYSSFAVETAQRLLKKKQNA